MKLVTALFYPNLLNILSRPQWLACVLVPFIILLAMVSLVSGPMHLPYYESVLAGIDAVLGSSMSALDDTQRVVISELRLPRLMLALLVGAMLAQCGTVMQGLFRNPLADPGIVGVSTGAAVGAVLAIAILPASLGAVAVPVAAFLGGLFTTLLVYRLAHAQQGTSILMLLLAGVAISAFGGALIGLVSYFANDEVLREVSLWQMGSLANAHSVNLALAALVLTFLGMAYQREARALDALLLGESEARHLGIDVERLKLRLIILCAVGVGIAVASAGMIGFVGLVVPHLMRLILGPGHRALLPLSALGGALLLLAADLAARTLVPPAELPIGLVTALIGAPFFLALLRQQRRHGL